MAHFIAEIRGKAGPATRLGTEKSGIYAEVNGWNIGVKVFIDYDPTTNKDIITILQTGGSNHAQHSQDITGIKRNMRTGNLDFEEIQIAEEK